MLLPHYRRLAQRNLEIAFREEKSAAELRRIIRRHFQRLGANLLCSVKMGSMPLEEVAKCVSTRECGRSAQRVARGTAAGRASESPRQLGILCAAFPDPLRITSGSAPFIRRSATVISTPTSGGSGPAPAWNCSIARKDSRSHRSAALRWSDRDFDRSTRGRSWPLDAVFRPTRFDLAAPRSARETNRCGRHRGGDRHRRPGPLANGFHAADRFSGRFGCGNHGEDQRRLEQQIRRAPEDWFWVHNRWKTPKPNFLLTNYKRGVYLPANGSATKLKPFRILIRGTNWLGDSVISMPAVRAIKLGRPDAHVTVAAPAKLAPVWKLVPEVDEVIPLPTDSLLSDGEVDRRQQPFDVAILFPNSLRSALEVWLARIPRRVGYRGHHRSLALESDHSGAPATRSHRAPGPPLSAHCPASGRRLEKSPRLPPIGE